MRHIPAIVELSRSSSAGMHILLVDDFEPWRSQVRSFLEGEAQWKVFEACDGLEGVHKAAELHPDFVLLDVSMPGLNGIKAAERICELSPSSKIIFLTENADEEIMAAAFEIGAVAYVLKSEMLSELILAIRTALQVEP